MYGNSLLTYLLHMIQAGGSQEIIHIHIQEALTPLGARSVWVNLFQFWE